MGLADFAAQELESAVPVARQVETGLRIPDILLEEDETATAPQTGPGQKYALGPTTLAGETEQPAATLPISYGTGKLLLAPLDPHGLYAQWDLTPQQQRRYNALSTDRHLVVRVYSGPLTEQPFTEVHVHPESRHWFIHVPHPASSYVAQLGYYRPEHQWVVVATSTPAATLPGSVSADQTVRFATIPAHVRLTRLAALAHQTVIPDPPPRAAARERALAELVALNAGQHDAMSSAQAGQEVSAAQAGPLEGKAESPSSPWGGAEQPLAGFWFNVNADLVVYGATEPDATVTIGGRPVSLRPDGSFSCRFALPDGEHSVTVSAMSARGELRQAELHVSRRTNYRGESGAAPQDPSLDPPPARKP
ncbi:MAG TPA: DUF4912 domain-containing protein [Candidatus Paceibacterota bacterium]|nr:DUF4912 domain-containing protein [Verrucomicrobiota bacterium]HSA09703.1 DUF4912 domain-containing protein [Candidatus Paceibacterota bacterium]